MKTLTTKPKKEKKEKVDNEDSLLKIYGVSKPVLTKVVDILSETSTVSDKLKDLKKLKIKDLEGFILAISFSSYFECFSVASAKRLLDKAGGLISAEKEEKDDIRHKLLDVFNIFMIIQSKLSDNREDLLLLILYILPLLISTQLVTVSMVSDIIQAITKTNKLDLSTTLLSLSTAISSMVELTFETDTATKH